MRRILVGLVTGLSLALSTVPPAAAAGPHFVYQQQGHLSPFTSSRTYILPGRPTPTGCAYSYPEIEVPAGIDHWQVRDVAIDQGRCVKLVEEGVPTVSEAAATSMASTTASFGGDGVLSATTTASGYAHAWFENIFGQSLTSDTTYLTWGYSGGCVTSSSSYGDWAWNYGLGWGLVSNSGSRSQACAQVSATTWSTFSGLLGCYQYYYSVTAIGRGNGSFTANRSDSATCGPIWEHFDYQKTT